MISYKLLAIFTVVIVIRSSRGVETECEKSLYQFGIEYNCGYLNFNLVKASYYNKTVTSNLDYLKKFKEFYGIKSLDDVESKKKEGYLQKYIDSTHGFSNRTLEREVYNTDSLIPEKFCRNQKKESLHDLLAKKMDEGLEELRKELENQPVINSPKTVTVDFSALKKDVTTCNNEILNYTLDCTNWKSSCSDHIRNNVEQFTDKTIRFSTENPYINALISYEIFTMASANFNHDEVAKGPNLYGMQDDVHELYLVYTDNILALQNEDESGIPNVYSQFLPSDFCKLEFPAEYLK